jgi:hypothetical protein
MHRSAIVFALYLSFALALGAACGPSEPETPGDDAFSPNSGGTKSSGGSGGSSGGAGGAGGTTGGSFSGGTGGSATGGTGGGVTGGTGGSVMGGAGRANTGGTTGGTTGGGAGTVGTTGGTSGGMASATGGMGAVGTGGQSSVSCDAAFAVGMDGFVRMPGKGGGCYSGYAFAGGDTTSTVTFPGGGTDFTKAMGVLNISGTVGSATEANEYAGSVYFGFNIGQKVGGTNTKVVPTGTGITVTCTGCATPAMRVQLVSGSTQWCAPLTSGTAVPYTTFKTQCWEGGTSVVYAKEAIESIQISIPGGAADATFDLTLTSVVEN